MATIKFLIQSQNDFAPIYVRLSIDKYTSLKRKTRETVNPKYWDTKKGSTKNIDKLAVSKDERKRLSDTKTKLEELTTYIQEQFSNRKDTEIINGIWLDEIINAYYSGGRRLELLDNLNTFLDYFERKILPYKSNAKTGEPLSEKTQGKYKDIIRHLKGFMQKENLNLKVSDYNKHISDRFQDYLKNVLKHSAVSIGREIIIPKTILKDAKRLNIKVDELLYLEVKGSSPQTPCPILIIDKERGIDELQPIKDLIFINDRLELARDWMIIGIHTGQRVTDLFNLNTKMIITKNGRKYIALGQDKTGAKVEIPINKDVLQILDKYNGNFPPPFVPNADSNTTLFLQYIKKICKLANLDRLDYGKKWIADKDGKNGRFVYGQYPIYDLFNAHSLRRTFATMYYGYLPTSVIISVTGHSTERQLLIYINKKGDELSHKFYDLWERWENVESAQPQQNTKTAN